MSKLAYKFLFSLILLSIVVFVVQPPAWAFMPSIHIDITNKAISSIQYEIGGRKVKFTKQAIQEINSANIHTDDLIFQTRSSFHFDNEDFIGGSKRLINLKRLLVANISMDSPKGSNARSDLGGALHTVQDFYSHSNWVEMGNNSINPKLGREIFTGATTKIATCSRDPGILSAAGQSQLTSGYFLFNRVLCGVPSGKCRHGLKFLGCPNGLNKDDSSRIGFIKAQALGVKASEDLIYQVLNDQMITKNVKLVKILMGID
jgi:von Willebrand factor A domain-containing protein 7